MCNLGICIECWKGPEGACHNCIEELDDNHSTITYEHEEGRQEDWELPEALGAPDNREPAAFKNTTKEQLARAMWGPTPTETAQTAPAPTNPGTDLIASPDNPQIWAYPPLH